MNTLHRPQPARLSLGTSLLLVAAIPGAEAWTGTLPGGGELQVDPDTHRATRVDGGYSVPMWDGVHRLDDGSVVIIRDGTAVPTEQMLNAWDTGAPRQDELADRPCEQLERLVCGDDNACRSSAACYSVRRMLNAEREATRRLPPGVGGGGSTDESKACESALRGQRFPPCTQSQSATGPSPCQRLVERVCGAASECEDAPPCPPARQLLRQEAAERSGSGGRDSLTPSGGQCTEAMDNTFFAPCNGP